MTEQEQNGAIAEECGWEHCHIRSGKLVGYAPCKKRDVQGPFGRTVSFTEPFVSEPPKYVQDLNAMHEAQATLSNKDRTVFGEFLATVLGYYDDYYDGWNLGPADFFALSHATASQKAKAFLLTVNKWKE